MFIQVEKSDFWKKWWFLNNIFWVLFVHSSTRNGPNRCLLLYCCREKSAKVPGTRKFFLYFSVFPSHSEATSNIGLARNWRIENWQWEMAQECFKEVTHALHCTSVLFYIILKFRKALFLNYAHEDLQYEISLFEHWTAQFLIIVTVKCRNWWMSTFTDIRQTSVFHSNIVTSSF